MPKEDALPYFRWYVRDYRSNRKVQRMSWQARGLYRELLDEYWIEGSLPDDVVELADICGCTVAEFEAYWPEIKQHLYLDERGRLRNYKMDTQRTEKDLERLVRQAAGRVGGLAKLASVTTKQEELDQVQRSQAQAKGCLADAKENLASAKQGLPNGDGSHIARAIAEAGAEAKAPAGETTDLLVRKIVCAHPRNRERQIQLTEVRPAHELAVFEAMEAEVKRSRCTERQALAMIFERVAMLADKVPRHRWKFMKEVDEFFRLKEYRKEPEDFMGTTGGEANGNSGGSTGQAGAVGRVKRGINAWERADEELDSPGAADEANAGLLPPPGVRGRDDPGVPVRHAKA